MARVALPESRLKARKRRRRVRLLLAFVALLCVLCAAFVAAAHIPALQVRAVTVSGTETLSSSTVRAFVEERIAGNYLWVLPKRNIFLYPRQEINQELLAAFPVLASADVHAGDFHTIAAAVVERSPRALWCVEQGNCLFMDENGVVYAPAPIFSEPVYISYYGPTSGLTLPKQYLTEAEFQNLSALIDTIALKLHDEQVLGVVVDASRDVRVEFSSGFKILFALNTASGDTFERLTLALLADPVKTHPLSDFEYIDLRFGDKVYYKIKQ